MADKGKAINTDVDLMTEIGKQQVTCHICP